MKNVPKVLLLDVCLIYLCYCFNYENYCTESELPRTVYIGSSIDLKKESNKETLKKVQELKKTIQRKFSGIEVKISRHIKKDLLDTQNMNYQYHIVGEGLLLPPVTIFLDAMEFYQHSYNEILEQNFIYAGQGIQEIDEPLTANKCNGQYYRYMCHTRVEKNNDTSMLHLMQQKCNESDKHIVPQDATCAISTKIYMVMLLSKNVINFPALYQFIINYKELQKSEESQKVEACLIEERQVSVIVCEFKIDKYTVDKIENAYSSKVVSIKFEDECKNIKTDASTIAVLAPKPFEVPGVMKITTIFVDDHYTLPLAEDAAADVFINSFSWMPIEKTIYAIYKFLEMNNWNRVAIISDDLPTSKEYEHRMTALLENQKVIYVSRSCDILYCNYTEILSPLVAAQAKVIIANIEHNDAENFAEQVKMWPHLVWLCKSPNLARDLANQGLQVFVTTIAASTTDICTSHNNCNYIPILSAIYMYNIHYHIVESFPGQLRTHESFNQSEFAAYIKNELYNRTRVKAYIHKYVYDGVLKTNIVAAMEILPSNDVEKYEYYENIRKKIPDELSSCTLRSSVYLKPCYDTEYMFLILILAVFLLMILAILYFFQSVEISYTRMN